MTIATPPQVQLGTLAGSLGLTLVVQVLSSLLALGVPVLAPEIARDRGWDPSLIGFYPGLMYVAALAICLFGERLLWRMGPMRRSLAAIAISAVGFALLLAPALGMMALAALVIGIGYGPVVPASSQILSANTPPRYSNLVFSLKQTGAPLGGFLAGALLPQLVELGSWRSAVLSVVIGSLVLTLLLTPSIAWLDRGFRRGGPGASFVEPLRCVLQVPALARLLCASFTYSAMQLCLGAFLTVYLVERQGLQLGQAGLLFGISQAASMAGRIGWGVVADRLLSPFAVIIGLGVLMAASAATVAAFTPDWPFWAMALVCALYGGTSMGWNGVLLSEVARLAPRGQAGLFTSGAMSINFFGVLIGPLLFTLVLKLTGHYEAGFIAIGLFSLAGAAMALFGRPALVLARRGSAIR